MNEGRPFPWRGVRPSGNASPWRGVRPFSAAEPIPALSASQFRVLLLTLLLGVLLAALDGTIVSVALPTIVGDLGGISGTHWVVTAYLLTATTSTLLYGRLSDVFGRKPTFLAAVSIFLAGSALCGAAQGFGTLAAARALQGLGGGGLLTLAMAIIADLVPARSRARYQGLFGAVFGLASVLGPLIGGLVVDNTSWRWLFYLNLPLGLVVLTVIATRLPLPSRRREHRLDLGGALLFAAAVGCFLCWITRGQEVGYSQPESWILGLVALGLAPAFVLSQRRAPEPVLPLHLFRNPTFALTGAVAFCVGIALFAAILFVPLDLQLVQNRSATASGLMLVAMTTGLLITSVGTGRAVSRTGRHKAPPIVGTALITLAMLGLTRLDAGTSPGATAGILAVLGLGIGMVSPVLVTVAQGSVSPREIGVATASVSFFRNLGGTVGSAVGVAILTGVLTHRLSGANVVGVDPNRLSVLPDDVAALPTPGREAFVAAFADAAAAVFWVAAAVGAVAVVLAALTPAVTLHQAAPDPGGPDPGEPDAGDADAGDTDRSEDQYESPPTTRAAAPTSPAS